MLAAPTTRTVAVSGSTWTGLEAHHANRLHEDAEEPGTETVVV